MPAVGLPALSAVAALARATTRASPRRANASVFPRRKQRLSFPSRAAANRDDADAPPEASGDEEFARVRQIKAERKQKAMRYKTDADEDASVVAATSGDVLDTDAEASLVSDSLRGDETDSSVSAQLGSSNRDRLLSSVNRNLALEMVRVTESAAVAAARWLGKGDKISADGAAVRAMRAKLKEVDFDGVVVVGEGAKDNAPMLFPGEKVGSGLGPRVDVAVDPLEGTALIANGKDGGIAVVAVAERGAMFNPGPIGFYVDKIAVGPEAAGHVDLTKSPTLNVHAIAAAKRKSVKDVTCAVLDRDRHVGLIEELRLAGARIKLIEHGDVEAALATCDPHSGVDALFGVGGAAEGVVAAAALRCAGGEMQAQLWPRNAADAAAMRAAGCDLTKVLRTSDLCGGGAILFAATGVSDGRALRGVRFDENGARSSSIVMRYPSRTVRRVETTHTWRKETEAHSANGLDEDEHERIYRAR